MFGEKAWDEWILFKQTMMFPFSFLLNSSYFFFLLSFLTSFNLEEFSVQFSSVAQSCLALCGPMDCCLPGFSVHPSPTPRAYSNSCPLNRWFHPTTSSLLLLPSIFPSIRVSSSDSVLCIRWQKYWSFSFSFSPFNEYSGLISFRMDWLELLAVQGTLKSLLQHHSSKASILQHSAFFMVQFSHIYMTTGKTMILTIRTFVGKVMSLLLDLENYCDVSTESSCFPHINFPHY